MNLIKKCQKAYDTDSNQLAAFVERSFWAEAFHFLGEVKHGYKSYKLLQQKL